MILLDTHIWIWWVHDENRLMALSPRIAVESTRLPGTFHRDPADQILVAAARVHGFPLVSSDEKIIRYPYVQTVFQ